MQERTPRVLLYSHDGMGLGHMRRNVNLAAAIVAADPSACVLMATGGDEVEGFDLPPRTDVVRLPGIRKVTNDRYVARRLAIPPRDVHAVRAGLLTSLVDSFAPTALVVDKHVLGAKREMAGALERARERGAAALLGLRDILDDPAEVREEWARIGAAAAINTLYERVLVYGAPSVASPVRDYGLPSHLARRIRFCGYVTEPPGRESSPRPRADHRPRILASAGGGEDGHELLSTFVEAAAGQGWNAEVVAGPHADAAEQSRLRRAATALGVTFHEFVPDLAQRFAEVDAVVCMGGYNTLVEAVVRGTPTVCVPRIVPRTEQLIRARAFEAIGLVECLAPGQLARDTLRAALGRALGRDRVALRARAHEMLAFDGAAHGAAEILAAARRGERRAARMGARPPTAAGVAEAV